MQDVIMKNGLKYGLIIGVTLSLLIYLIYCIDIQFFISWQRTVTIFVIFIFFPSLALIETKKELLEEFKFKQAFTTFYICTCIGIGISVLFNIILLNYIDPSVKKPLLDISVKYLIESSNQLGVSKEVLNKMIENLKSTDPFSAVEQLKGGIQSLFFSSIFGLIMAYIFKSKTNTIQK